MKPVRYSPFLIKLWIKWSDEAITRHLKLGELRHAIHHLKQKRQFQRQLIAREQEVEAHIE